MDLDRVRSLLATISDRRWFLAQLERKRAEKYEKGTPSFIVILSYINGFLIDIPSIVVESMPGTPLMSSRDISSAGFEHHFPGSPTPVDARYSNADYPLGVDTSGPRLQRSSRRASDYSTYSTDTFKSPCATVLFLFVFTKIKHPFILQENVTCWRWYTSARCCNGNAGFNLGRWDYIFHILDINHSHYRFFFFLVPRPDDGGGGRGEGQSEFLNR